MKKFLFLLLVITFFATGCSVVNYDSVNTIIDTILYKDTKLSNTNFEGYSFYLPQGTKIVDKNDYNFKIKDNDNYYYLYIDTIAYHYQTKNEYDINLDHFYTKELSYDNMFGYIDINEINDKYFIVIMYNYAKIECYVSKDNFKDVIANMCSLLASIKYNDKVIDAYIDSDKSISQEEEFDIFSSKNENDNFLKYEQEYDNYEENDKNTGINDEDHIELNDD